MDLSKRAASELDSMRDENGKLPAYAWPGGYQIIYIMSDGEVLCPACANGENGSEARTTNGPDDAPRDGWLIEGYSLLEEGMEYCAHCGTQLGADDGLQEDEDIL